jgi:hypothetical protein
VLPTLTTTCWPSSANGCTKGTLAPTEQRERLIELLVPREH